MAEPQQNPRPQPGKRPVARKERKRLAPSQKYQVFVEVLTGQATQREAAAKYGIERSTVASICRTAKQGALDALAASVPGRPGKSTEQLEQRPPAPRSSGWPRR